MLRLSASLKLPDGPVGALVRKGRAEAIAASAESDGGIVVPIAHGQGSIAFANQTLGSGLIGTESGGWSIGGKSRRECTDAKARKESNCDTHDCSPVFPGAVCRSVRSGTELHLSSVWLAAESLLPGV